MVSAIPTGFTEITPYLIVADIQKTIDFLKTVANGKLEYSMPGPGGKVMHAEMTIGRAKIMMGASSDKYPPLPAMVYLYLPDVDAAFARAKSIAGVEVVHDVMDMFYGDRSGAVKDPNGISWAIATHKEDLTPQEIGERMSKMGPPKKQS